MHAAQVLLTSYDLSVRMHYLNARQALRRMLDWHAVPVVNENDTTATDEITFGDNDFLSAQLALLLGARMLVLLTDTPGLHTADPRRDPEATRVARVQDFAELDGLRDRRSALAVRVGRDAEQGVGRRDGERRRDPRRDLRRHRGGIAAGGRARGRRGDGLRRPSRAHALVQALAALREAGARADRGGLGRSAGVARERLEPAAGGHRRGGGRVRRRRRGRRRRRRRPGGQGDRELLGRRAGAHQGDEVGRGAWSCLPNASEEAVHRDRFVLA